MMQDSGLGRHGRGVRSGQTEEKAADLWSGEKTRVREFLSEILPSWSRRKCKIKELCLPFFCHQSFCPISAISQKVQNGKLARIIQEIGN